MEDPTLSRAAEAHPDPEVRPDAEPAPATERGVASSRSVRDRVAAALERPLTAVLAAVLLVALSFGVGALASPLVFDTNDDAAMLGIAAGYFGEGIGDPRLVYQSAFLGRLLGALYRVTTAFDWYSAFQWLVCIVAYATVVIVLLRARREPAHWLAVAFTTLAFLPPTLIRIQFTQTAFACLAAALVLLVSLAAHWRARRISAARAGAALGGAAAFCLLAGALRASTLPVGLALVGLGGGLLASIAWVRRDRRFAAGVAVAAIAFVGVVQAAHSGLGLLEERVYYADEDWSAFHRHHADRAFVLENWPRWIGVEQISAALQARMGVTAEELAAMARWIPVDARLYSIEGFREMAEIVRSIESEGPLQPRRLAESAVALRTFLASTPVFVAVLVWLVAHTLVRVVVSPGDRRRAFALGVTFALLPIAFWLGVDLLFRPPPYRVWMPFLAVDAWLYLALASIDPSPRSDAAEAPAPPSRGPGLAALQVRWGLAGVLATLAIAFPLHLEVARLLAARVADRPNDCAMTAAHLWALQQRPPGAQAFVAPMVVHSECFVNPFRVEVPRTLLVDAHTFGWRNLMPPVHDALFAHGPNVFDAICARPDNMLVLHPSQRVYLDHYLARHRPDLRLERYADQLPPAVLACRRDPVADDPSVRIGQRPGR